MASENLRRIAQNCAGLRRSARTLPSSLWSVLCISTIDMPISAPWRTMSTESESIGVRRSIASRSPVPAHEIPTAIVAP